MFRQTTSPDMRANILSHMAADVRGAQEARVANGGMGKEDPRLAW